MVQAGMVLKTKKSMTSFDLAAVVSEASRLVGDRVVNIYALPRGFLFKLRGGRLVAVPGERIHITGYDVAEKGFPPPLVMGLRKYLRGAKLEAIEQYGFDRIAVLRFSGSGGVYRVYVELLPRGVLALTDERGTILHVSETKQMKDRVLRRGVEYKPPPGRLLIPEELEPSTVRSLVSESAGDAVRVLVRGLGYPGGGPGGA
jgi:predicted ribosome quality control (RQC) complex YloA/Tae2 family protein